MKATDLNHIRITINSLEAALYARNHRWTADQQSQLRRARNIIAKDKKEPNGSGERGEHEASLLDTTE